MFDFAVQRSLGLNNSLHYENRDLQPPEAPLDNDGIFSLLICNRSPSQMNH